MSSYDVMVPRPGEDKLHLGEPKGSLEMTVLLRRGELLLRLGELLFRLGKLLFRLGELLHLNEAIPSPRRSGAFEHNFYLHVFHPFLCLIFPSLSTKHYRMGD